MRWRFVKNGRRGRMMIRSNSAHDLVTLERGMKPLGFIRVGFLKYWIHVFSRERRVKRDFYGNDIEQKI